jgi:hypothetical protein
MLARVAVTSKCLARALPAAPIRMLSVDDGPLGKRERAMEVREAVHAPAGRWVGLGVVGWRVALGRAPCSCFEAHAVSGPSHARAACSPSPPRAPCAPVPFFRHEQKAYFNKEDEKLLRVSGFAPCVRLAVCRCGCSPAAPTPAVPCRACRSFPPSGVPPPRVQHLLGKLKTQADKVCLGMVWPPQAGLARARW